ncbi:MAG: Y-family DNA polymerase [Bacteroidales bacterium]
MIGLCDCNNFFVSCERVFDPSLNGKPVLVLSGNDGCVIARSNETKALGIKMGTPVFKIKDIVEKYDIKLFSTNFPLYGDMSKRVMNTLKAYTPAIEVYSIDESFLDFSQFPLESLKGNGEKIAKIVRRNTGIPVSIGIAPSKTLAKIASKLCKQYPALKGACLLYKDKDIEKVLSRFPIEDVWGIGRRYSKMLKEYHVFTALDFFHCSPDWVEKRMSIVGLRTWKELHGISCISFEHTLPDKQTICVSRSFSRDVEDVDEIKAAVSKFTTTIAMKLRKQNSCAGQITIYIMTNRFREDKPQMFQSFPIKLEVPTNSTLELVKIAVSTIDKIYRKGYGYKKAGVIVSDLHSSNNIQLSLFDKLDRNKHSKLMRTLDGINARRGRDTVILASSDKKLSIKSEHISNRFTTSWDEIIDVKV